ncbi:poly(3-hydroxybutyrate) depolymerase [Sphingomonas naasensis]|uniref:Polyhydroxyalkanoate depolymerase n=1 Tax=Sphingomonas naasensis TaxID=1344951 RepID=A0A4S1WJQ0_9SPHN|nr:polyhydroxyalkanoate depolymerase [Sphingomonas naasensis]NIJ20975.1 poly(3-hydroxybutyrate) depolymerase [Sphingomonas naasensis]TGX43359.1 polyhydroxyalkanoate depolymerase [Sphingomonas naasensis]
MLYDAYEIQRSLLAGASAWANFSAGLLNNPANPFAYFGGGPVLASALEVFAHAAAPRGKPNFGLDFTTIDGKQVEVREEIVLRKPFGQLKRFVRQGVEGGPRLLIVAPMSGHYATLLRGTVERMLPVADVYITDWRDAKLVPLADGRFDLDDYIDYLTEFLAFIGKDGDPRAHVLAVCQPSVPAFATAALMSADKHPNRPKTLTMMGGPIDTREAPTAVNTLATERPHAWFEQNVIATIPVTYPGAGRKVYPGFLQLAGFMTMNLGSHMISHWEMFKHLVQGDDEGAESTMSFYEEYRSVCDMTAEFYLQTIDVVFQSHALPKGEMLHRGRRVDPSAITDVAILAIEGERDDISGLGQTRAALTIADKLPAKLKQYHMAPAVGHYGIFNGSKWRTKIAPVLEQWIAAHD